MENRKNNLSARLVKLSSSFRTLDDLAGLPTTFKRPIRVSARMGSLLADLPEKDKYIYYQWKDNENERFELTIPSENGNDKTVQFVVKSALLEHQTRQIYNGTKSGLLPRSERTKLDFVDTVFFRVDRFIYAIICTKTSVKSEKVKELIGQANLDLVAPLSFEPDMFSWLFWNYMDQQGHISDAVTTEGILGFVGNVLENDPTDVVSGQSENTAQLTVTKTSLALGYSLTSVSLNQSISDSQLIYTFSVDGTVTINSELSVLSEDVVSQGIAGDISSFQQLIYLYAYLLPLLLQLYERQNNTYGDTKVDFNKKLGMEVINSILSKNDFSQDELHNLLPANDLNDDSSPE